LKSIKKFEATSRFTPSPSDRPSLRDSPIVFAPCSALISRSLMVIKDHATDRKYSPRGMGPAIQNRIESP
jgi:hypothetical protein